MTVGMLLAGGIGERVGYGIPKQFITVNGKPIILYPLEIMENHPQIDAIEIVCVESYIDIMWDIVKQAGLKKVKWIVKGGKTCQDSSYLGLISLEKVLKKDDIVLFHMSSFPLANSDIMSKCIESAINNGNGYCVKPIVNSVYFTDDRKTTDSQIDRDKLVLGTVPYAFKYGECCDVYEKAFQMNIGIVGNVYTTTLYCDMGKKLYLVPDSPTNIKITTYEDILIMETFLNKGLIK